MQTFNSCRKFKFKTRFTFFWTSFISLNVLLNWMDYLPNNCYHCVFFYIFLKIVFSSFFIFKNFVTYFTHEKWKIVFNQTAYYKIKNKIKNVIKNKLTWLNCFSHLIIFPLILCFNFIEKLIKKCFSSSKFKFQFRTKSKHWWWIWKESLRFFSRAELYLIVRMKSVYKGYVLHMHQNVL